MSNIEKYRKYFTKDYLMGPNSFRLLDEALARKTRIYLANFFARISGPTN